MQTNFLSYDYLKSVSRIDDIISESENSFEELDSIPSRDRLTFTNGFYVYCSCLSVDIRDSSELPQKHNRPKLAKLYRSYISEVVAVMNGNIDCKEINIIGDGITGIFTSPYTTNIDHVFSTSAEISSLIKFLNYKYNKNDISEISVGIGIDYGRALMIKAGYKGSTINDVVWMGDVVNRATHLASFGNRTYNDKQTMVSNVIQSNLNDDNKSLLSYNSARSCYHCNIINLSMEDWYQEHCT